MTSFSLIQNKQWIVNRLNFIIRMDDISEETFLITGSEGIIKRYPKDYSVMNQRSDIIHTDIQISANLNLPDVKINTSLCLK